MSTDCTDLLSISELHRRLLAGGEKINRSTLSRYVTRYADALNPVVQGRDTLVSFEAFTRHRTENINVADKRPARRDDYASSKAASSSKARKEEADAGLKEIELAKAQNLLTPSAEVATAGREAISALNAAFDLAVQDTADRLAGATGADARVIRPHLRKLKEVAIESFRQKLLGSLPTGEGGTADLNA